MTPLSVALVLNQLLISHSLRRITPTNSMPAIVLDLGPPGESGLVLLRAGYDPAPVIIPMARAYMNDDIAGLDAGADDYVVRPFEFNELRARMLAAASGRLGCHRRPGFASGRQTQA